MGQLGIVLPASTPLRVAEDIAMLDHMSGGRAFAGFARGYQRRWVDTLAQQYHNVHAAPSKDRDAEVDRVNRAAFEEFFEIVKLAWTEDTFSYKGNFWQMPPPDVPWDLEATRRMGRGVGGRHRARDWRRAEAAAAAAPADHAAVQLQRADDPLVRPQRRAADPRADQRPSWKRSCSGCTTRRRTRPGAGWRRARVWAYCATSSWPIRTKRRGRSGGTRAAFVGAAWFAPFGFGSATPRPGEDPRAITPEVMHERGLMWVGSPATVRRQVEQTLERIPLKYVMAWQYNGLMPRAAVAKSLRLFNDEVLAKL